MYRACEELPNCDVCSSEMEYDHDEDIYICTVCGRILQDDEYRDTIVHSLELNI